MATAYSGGWVRATAHDPSAAKVHTADPTHAATSDDDHPQTQGYQAPPMQPAALVGDFPGSEWVIIAPGVVIDRTDYGSHQADAGQLGAARARNTAVEVPYTFAGEHYESARWPGLPGQDISTTAIQRGRNSASVNNPEGFALGHDDRYWVDRRFALGERVHDTRIYEVNTAYEQQDAPPPDPGTPWTSPFSSLARAMTRVWQRPSVRREPPPVSADLETEPDAYPAAVPSWVVM